MLNPINLLKCSTCSGFSSKKSTVSLLKILFEDITYFAIIRIFVLRLHIKESFRTFREGGRNTASIHSPLLMSHFCLYKVWKTSLFPLFENLIASTTTYMFFILF